MYTWDCIINATELVQSVSVELVWNKFLQVKLASPVIRVGPNVSKSLSIFTQSLTFQQLHFNYSQAYHDIYTYGSTLVKEPGFYQAFNAHAPKALLASVIRKLQGSEETYCSHCSPEGRCCPLSTRFSKSPGFSHPILRDIQKHVKRNWFERHFPFLVLSAPQKFVLWLLPDMESYVNINVGFERQIDNPDALLTVEHETVFHHLLELKDQERPSRESLVHEGFIFVGAGSDTVGNACTVGTWLDKDRPMSYAVLAKLPYLTAFIT
ncbi:hypothetical protein BDP27DRAFT_1358420 [Rhodocollybia butyracea]|uniref:Uncharacterized protein n=1 Tax=Rhodocollybia butyracea TaxID=206335 RepID=A0A9P5Q5H8_9AGAR|nr:hypothetical protein BDP27DRAFT_1358420 [Rhodocollybia butyracea]